MVKPVVLAIVSLAILVLVFGAMLPSRMQVERTTEIIAMPDQVFDHVNDLRAWEAWSPWYRMDPEADYVFRALFWRRGVVGLGRQGNSQGTTGYSHQRSTAEDPDCVRFRIRRCCGFEMDLQT